MLKKSIEKIPKIKKLVEERQAYYNHIVSLNKILKDKELNEIEQREILNSLNEVNQQLEENYKILEKQFENEIIKKQEAEEVISHLNITIENINSKHKIQLIEKDNELKVLNQEKQQLVQENQQLKKELSNFKGLNNPIDSKDFWESHYINGNNSGTGSYAHLAEFKAMIINSFLDQEKINTVIEFGCGDGNQLSLMEYKKYVGVDVSKSIINKNKDKYGTDKNKLFYTTEEKDKYFSQKYDLALSLDVIFHLTEEDVYEQYMHDLFASSQKYIIVYSSNHEEFTVWPEFRHRKFMRYVLENCTEWILIDFIPNKYPFQLGQEMTTSTSDFYIFKHKNLL
ncbi:methyltransferase domain-containing protein [Paenibacillus lautus]